MPSGTRDAEWRVKRKSAKTKRSHFQVHPAAERPPGMASGAWGYLFESTSVLPEETVRKRVLVLDYLRVSEDYIRSVYTSTTTYSVPRIKFLSLKSIAEECC